MCQVMHGDCFFFVLSNLNDYYIKMMVIFHNLTIFLPVCHPLNQILIQNENCLSVTFFSVVSFEFGIKNPQSFKHFISLTIHVPFSKTKFFDLVRYDKYRKFN